MFTIAEISCFPKKSVQERRGLFIDGSILPFTITAFIIGLLEILSGSPNMSPAIAYSCVAAGGFHIATCILALIWFGIAMIQKVNQSYLKD